MKINHLILLSLALLISSCATGGLRMSKQAREQSIAHGVLVDRVKSEILASEQKHNSTCTSFLIRQVDLMSSARGAGGRIISAREHWKIDRCGINVTYRVDYYGPIAESTNIHVQRISYY